MESFHVSPCEDVPSQVIDVSLADTLVPMVWIRQVLFWSIEKPVTYEQAFEDLTDGLSRLITEIPALTGRLTRRRQGARDISIAVDQNPSVRFKSRDATKNKSSPSHETLRRGGFPVERLGKDFFPKEASEPVVEGSSMFWAQLNRIQGGAVLVFGFNHVLADGWSCSEMERLWALHTADASEGVAFRRHKITTPDIEIRRQLSTPSRSSAKEQESEEPGALSRFMKLFPEGETLSYLHRDLKSFKSALRKTIFRMLKRLIVTDARLESRSQAIWKFSSASLADLKQASSEADADTWISTKDALAGLFWSRISAVQGRTGLVGEKGGLKALSTCLFVLNIRKRLRPNVADEYVGNVVGSTVAQCTLENLSAGIEGVRHAAQSLRRANQSWSEAHFKSALNAVTSVPSGKALGLDRDFITDKQNLFYDDFSAMQSNILDWGSNLGQVARTRFPSAALPAGAPTLMVHPRFPDGALEVSLTCTDETRRALDADEIFGEYAVFVGQEVSSSQRGLVHIMTIALWWTVSRVGRLYWWREVADQRKCK